MGNFTHTNTSYVNIIYDHETIVVHLINSTYTYNTTQSQQYKDAEDNVITYPFQSVCLPDAYFYLCFAISAMFIEFLFIRVGKTAIKLEKAITQYQNQANSSDTVNDDKDNNEEDEDDNHDSNDNDNIIQIDILDGKDEKEFEDPNITSDDNIFLIPKLGTSDFGISMDTLTKTVTQALEDEVCNSSNNINDYSDICKIITNYGYTLNPIESAVLKLFLKFIKYSRHLLSVAFVKMFLRLVYIIFILVAASQYGIEQVYYQFIMSSTSSLLFTVELIQICATRYFHDKFCKFSQIGEELLHNLKAKDIDTDINNLKLIYFIENDSAKQQNALKIACYGHMFFTFIILFVIKCFEFILIAKNINVFIVLLLLGVYIWLHVCFILAVCKLLATESIIKSKHIYIGAGFLCWILPLFYVFIVYLIFTLVNGDTFCPTQDIGDIIENSNGYNLWYSLGWLLM